MFATKISMLKTSLGKRSYALKKSSEERDPVDENTDDSSCVRLIDSSCAKMTSESSCSKTLGSLVQSGSSNMAMNNDSDNQ